MTHVVPRVLCVGVAGAGRENERQALWQALVGRDLATDVVVHSDFGIALDDAFGDGPGVLLVAGTGSVAFRPVAAGDDGALRRLGSGVRRRRQRRLDRTARAVDRDGGGRRPRVADRRSPAQSSPRPS